MYNVRQSLLHFCLFLTAVTCPCRHVSSQDKLGKRYRNVPNVFSIADEDDDHEIGEADVQMLPVAIKYIASSFSFVRTCT